MNRRLWIMGLMLTAINFSPLFSEEEIVEDKVSFLSCEECKCSEEEKIEPCSFFACKECGSFEEEEKLEG